MTLANDTIEHTDNRGRCVRCGKQRSQCTWWGEAHCDNYAAPALLAALLEAQAAFARMGADTGRQHITLGMLNRIDDTIASATEVSA